MTTLSLSIQTRLLNWEHTGSCFATETTSFYSLTHLDLHSTITRMYVIDYLFADLGVTEIIQAPLQNFDSNLCGLYCIYIAHYVFGAHFPIIPYISEQELMRFVKHFI